MFLNLDHLFHYLTLSVITLDSSMEAVSDLFILVISVIMIFYVGFYWISVAG